MRRSTPVAILASALALGAAPAWASPGSAPIFAAKKAVTSAKKNIAVGQIEGPKASKIRVALMLRIKDAGYLVTDAEDLKTGSSKTSIKKMATALQVDTLLLGKISGSNDLTLSVYKPDGRLVEQIKVKGGSSTKLENAIQNEFDGVIAAPLARASGGKGVVAAVDEDKPAEEEAEPEVAESQAAQPPPEEQKPSAAEQPPEEEKPVEAAAKDDDDDKKPAKPGRAPLELDLRLRVYSRAWKYTGMRGVRDPSQPHRTLEPYNLDFAPAIDFAGIVYPAAFFTDGVASHFGLMGSFMQGFATSTDFEQQIPGATNKVVTELKTSSQAWDMGVRGRIPIGPAEIALFATYGSQSFILHGDEGGTGSLAPLVPDVRYTFIRLGGEARVRFAKVLVGAHIAPRILTSLHKIDLVNVWFPGAKGSGLDFGLTVGYGVLPFMDVTLSADFVGYGFDFNGIPQNPQVAPVVAGGATDRYNSLSLGVKFTLGGT
jgi:hypothetical protein